MVFINEQKYACETCIKGHRSSACNHADRPLFEIKKKGRPTTQCDHCRQLRKTKQVHIKCVCESKEEVVGPQISFSIPTKKSNRVGIDFQAAFPHGLADNTSDARTNITSEAVVSPAATPDSASTGTHASASASANANANARVPCTCGSGAGETCTCWSPRQSSSAKSSRRSTTSRHASPPSALVMTTSTARTATAAGAAGRAGGQERGYYPQQGTSPMTSFSSHPQSGSRSPVLPMELSHHDPSVGIPHGHSVRGAPAFSPYAAAHERHHVSPLDLDLEHDLAFDDTSATSREELEAFLRSLAGTSDATSPSGAMMAVSPDATSSPGSLSPGSSTPWGDTTFTQAVPLVSSMCDCGGDCNCRGCFINLASASGSSISRCNPSAPCSSCFQCQLSADTEEIIRTQSQSQNAFSTTSYDDPSQLSDLGSWLHDIAGEVPGSGSGSGSGSDQQDQDALLTSMMNWDAFSSGVPTIPGQGQVAPQLTFTPSPSSGPGPGFTDTSNPNDWVTNASSAAYFDRRVVDSHPHLRVPSQSQAQSPAPPSRSTSSRTSMSSVPRAGGSGNAGVSGGANSTSSLSRSSSSGSRMSSVSGSSGSSGMNMQQQQQQQRPPLPLPLPHRQTQPLPPPSHHQQQLYQNSHPHPHAHSLPLPHTHSQAHLQAAMMARGRTQVSPSSHPPPGTSAGMSMAMAMAMGVGSGPGGSNSSNSSSRVIRPKGNSPLPMPFGYHSSNSRSPPSE